MKTISKILLAACAAFAINACAEAADAPANKPVSAKADTTSANLDAVLAGDWRSDKNKARDQYRHPKQTLEFFGVKPTQTVVELEPGGAGWYMEILAPWLKAQGHYVAATFKPTRPNGEAARALDSMNKRIAEHPAQFGTVQVVQFEAKAPEFGAPESADVVLTFRNVHNWTDDDTAPQMFKAMYAVLKKGGTLGVVDHRAKPGTTLAANKETGYLPTEVVVKLATDAGFKLVAQSEINANPKDTKDYPKGVWTLPPTFAMKEVDHDKYAAIGESDRMTLKFVKPAVK
ncbi:MAG: class I SAM-dependent methyltransferase [Gammaproteobacteria bacterium]|nr:MAG: class I SAM-dependent methyltransferase [Gammaproteobacteria bacterium]